MLTANDPGRLHRPQNPGQPLLDLVDLAEPLVDAPVGINRRRVVGAVVLAA